MTTNEKGNSTGKVAFVTGAANGIGRATALAFAREGAHVVVADIAEQSNQETAHMIEELGGQAIAVRCDVTKAVGVNAALAKTGEAFGRLAVAFNHSRVQPRKPRPTARYRGRQWNGTGRTNLRGACRVRDT